jgi:predicted DCC family thiol-disulfide oxidoreductase YuxK
VGRQRSPLQESVEGIRGNRALDVNGGSPLQDEFTIELPPGIPPCRLTVAKIVMAVAEAFRVVAQFMMGGGGQSAVQGRLARRSPRAEADCSMPAANSSASTGATEAHSRKVVFDGLCNLCSGGARRLEHHPGYPAFRLVPMQSDLGRTLLARHGYDPDDPMTFLVLDGDRPLTQSDAWLHLVAGAGGGWRVVHGAGVIPASGATQSIGSLRAIDTAGSAVVGRVTYLPGPLIRIR